MSFCLLSFLFSSDVDGLPCVVIYTIDCEIGIQNTPLLLYPGKLHLCQNA